MSAPLPQDEDPARPSWLPLAVTALALLGYALLITDWPRWKRQRAPKTAPVPT